MDCIASDRTGLDWRWDGRPTLGGLAYLGFSSISLERSLFPRLFQFFDRSAACLFACLQRVADVSSCEGFESGSLRD